MKYAIKSRRGASWLAKIKKNSDQMLINKAQFSSYLSKSSTFFYYVKSN